MAFETIECAPSSNVAQVAYDRDAQTLMIVFARGPQYKYTQVPPSVAEGFSDAVSSGEYFLLSIKGQFPYERVS